jgi:virginiamycin B lyase
MRVNFKVLALIGLGVFAGPYCHAATITGSVKGVDGGPFQGAFVEAQNTKTKMNFIVLSDDQGKYQMEKVPAGEYRMTIRAVGFSADPQTGVNLTADQNASYNFSLKAGTVRWNDLNFAQFKTLMPAAKGKELIIRNCSICHLFQTRMASVRRDQDGWRDRVDFMRSAMHFSLGRITDQEADDIATYLASLFGPDSVLPKSPSELPGYQATVRPFSSDAMNIVYVEYDMPGPSRMPFSANPAKDGYVWIPNFGIANKITRLDPKTGQMEDFPVPHVGTAAVHSASPAPDGAVWLAEQGTNKLGRWDPVTQKITEYQDAYEPGHEGTSAFGEKHTVRVDPQGNAWATGVPLTKFDFETKKYTRFEEVHNAYDVQTDTNGDVWFTNPRNNKIGKVDGKTNKITQWSPPTPKSYPRRLQIGSDGIIWTDEFDAGKLASFDPKTETFKEYVLPGPDPTPYALGIDSQGGVWYNSHHQDVLGRLDPKTGKITEYPFPQSELTMREFFRDSEGRMWFGTNPNNKVGYFYLTGKNGTLVSSK